MNSAPDQPGAGPRPVMGEEEAQAAAPPVAMARSAPAPQAAGSWRRERVGRREDQAAPCRGAPPGSPAPTRGAAARSRQWGGGRRGRRRAAPSKAAIQSPSATAYHHQRCPWSSSRVSAASSRTKPRTPKRPAPGGSGVSGVRRGGNGKRNRDRAVRRLRFGSRRPAAGGSQPAAPQIAIRIEAVEEERRDEGDRRPRRAARRAARGRYRPSTASPARRRCGSCRSSASIPRVIE